MNNAQMEILRMFEDANNSDIAGSCGNTVIYEPGQAGSLPRNNGHINTSALLHKIRSDEAVSCYGGRLFRSEDPVCGPVVCFAVENMSKEEAELADKWYNLFGRMSHLGILHRSGTSPLRVDNYTVFEFELAPQEFSLREGIATGAPFRRDCTEVMRMLVNFLYRYRSELRKFRGSEYVPLNCLSKETIFFDSDNNLKILPLRAFRKQFPIEIPREATADEPMDERTDLYAAAFIAVEIYSLSQPGNQLSEPDSDLIRMCLKSIRDWRPTLDDVYTAVQTNEPIVSRSACSGVQDNFNRMPEKFRAFMGNAWNTIKELTKPYELEERETDFQRDDTMKVGAASRPAGSIRLRYDEPDDPDNTFHQ